MSPGGSPRPDFPRPIRRIASFRLAVSLLAVLLAAAGASRADIIRWEDEKGVVHFTDDISNVPARFRDKAGVIIRETPRSRSGNGRTGSPGDSPGAVPSPADPPGYDPVTGKEALAAQVEELRAKIAAKEQLIRYVDEKQSLATNPYRNRFVDPDDLSLYGKYKQELPEDKTRLGELEALLENFR
jgi:hypothetical protein